MLPDLDTFKWLHYQGTERIQELPDGSLIAFRKSVSMPKKTAYWAYLSLSKVIGGYVRTGDAWLLVDHPHPDAKAWQWQK